MSNNILGIDTTHPETVIGLNGKIVSWISHRNQAKELLPKIDKLLRTQKVPKEKIRGVAVNLGPGSFTGLRVGVTVANGFGYGLKIPVLGISEFDVIKKAYPKIDAIVLDAKRGELFIQKRSEKPKLIPAEKLSSEIKAGDRVYLDDYNLVSRLHSQLKKAGTIYIPNLTRKQKMELMLDNPKLPPVPTKPEIANPQFQRYGATGQASKFSQVLPLYLRGANITKPKK